MTGTKAVGLCAIHISKLSDEDTVSKAARLSGISTGKLPLHTYMTN